MSVLITGSREILFFIFLCCYRVEGKLKVFSTLMVIAELWIYLLINNLADNAPLVVKVL